MGRLHTRYAPVRRSPPVYCYTVLPLDLHVLGLPLAFILSQDQTLHCKKMFCYKSLALISKVLFEITLLQEWKKLLAAVVIFICLHLIIPVTMGSGNKNYVRVRAYKEVKYYTPWGYQEENTLYGDWSKAATATFK